MNANTPETTMQEFLRGDATKAVMADKVLRRLILKMLACPRGPRLIKNKMTRTKNEVLR